MSVNSASVASNPPSTLRTAGERLHAYFWSENRRRVQTLLGLLWMLDAGLQYQSFMYSHGFPAMLASMAAGQPVWLHDSVIWGARIANGNLTVWNTLFATTQALIGLGLLYRPSVKPALVASFGWVLVVWWFGEAFGMLFMDMAQPMTGAPGGVLMYALVGLLAWPGAGPGGLLGVRGAKAMWASLWLVMAWLWLMAPSANPGATHDMLADADSGIGALTSLQSSLASAADGHGLVIALVLCAASVAIGVAVAQGRRARRFLVLAMVLNAVYWVIPQGLGEIFTGEAPDPNAGPLFVLLAYAMWPLVRRSPGPDAAGRAGDNDRMAEGAAAEATLPS
jgi:hypothetical protein